MGKARVLLADDSPTFLAVVRDLLESHEYRVVAARDGLEAVELAFAEAPDVVLLDVEMPRMNGYQVCRMLKLDDQTSHIPVVMFTARDQPADHYWGVQTGADRYVTKDQGLEVVLEVVAECLEVARHRAGSARRRTGYRPPTAVDLLSRLNQILDRKLYEATILAEVSRLAWTATDLDRLSREIMALFEKLFDFRLACLLMRGNTSMPLEVLWMVRRQMDVDALAGMEDRVLAAMAERRGSPVELTGLRRRIVSAERIDSTPDGVGPSGSGGFHVAPLGSGRCEAGLLAMWSSDHAAMSQESLQIMGVLANAAVLVLDNARLYQEMQRLASTDEMTGLSNYRVFQDTLEREFQRSVRNATSLSLLMLDLDNFKGVNDTFGHKVGDQVLQSVGSVFRRNARQYDLMARYGGEEFAVILPDTDANGAVEVGERLRLLVRGVAARMKLARLSASVGVAVYPSGRIVEPQGLVREADAALYRAKSKGKDQVCLAPQD